MKYLIFTGYAAICQIGIVVAALFCLLKILLIGMPATWGWITCLSPLLPGILGLLFVILRHILTVRVYGGWDGFNYQYQRKWRWNAKNFTWKGQSTKV